MFVWLKIWRSLSYTETEDLTHRQFITKELNSNQTIIELQPPLSLKVLQSCFREVFIFSCLS